VQHVRAGVCHPIIWKTSLPRKRSLPSSTRFRKCFHLSCVTTRVCHPLTDLFRSLPPYHFSMYSSLPRGACRPLHVVIYVVHLLFQTLRRLVVRPSHPIVFAFDLLSRGVSHPRTSSLGESATPVISNVSLCSQRSLPLSSCCIICSVVSHLSFLFSKGDFSCIRFWN
jgi:hypothetical protein